MKFFQKKSNFFYVLLTFSLLFPAVAPDRFTPKASAMATLLSVSWGAGSVAVKGLAVSLATLTSAFINRKKSSDSSNVTHFPQGGYAQTHDQKIMGRRHVIGNDQASQSQNYFDVSQQENSLGNNFFEAGRDLAIVGKSLSNMANSYHGQENLNSIPLITDCVGQEMSNLQVNNITESKKYSWQTDQQDLFNVKDIQDLYQGVCSHQADEYQRGLDQYGNQLTDAQQKRFQNRRDAFLEVYNNPDKTSQYTNTFSAKSQQLFQSVGIFPLLLRGVFCDAFENCIWNEQCRIVDKLQEYSEQMPDGIERDFVTEYLTSNVKCADDYQQYGMHQLSLIPIDKSWMLIDTIDTYGFAVIDQSFIEKIQADQIHVPTKDANQTLWNVGAGLVDGACSPVRVVGHLMGLALHNPRETIKVSASLNIDAITALGACVKSMNKSIRGVTLTLLSWGVPESQLKDQLSHWSEQDFAEARAFAQESRERLQAFTGNPIIQGITEFGSSMMAGAHQIANSSYNILYGLCCMEAACEQNNIQLCELGEKIVTENLPIPSAYEVAHFVGEMLTLQYGPSVARKFASVCHNRGNLRKLVRSLAKKSAATAAAEKELLACASVATSENITGKQLKRLRNTKKIKNKSFSQNQTGKSKKLETVDKLSGRAWGDRIPQDHETILSNPKFKRTNYQYDGATIYKYKKKYYYRDKTHRGSGAHLEVFNKAYIHLGEANPITGEINYAKADPRKILRLS